MKAKKKLNELQLFALEFDSSKFQNCS